MRLRPHAEKALKRWGRGFRLGRSLNHADTTTFVVTKGRARYCLRLHNDANPTEREVWSELQWRLALAAEARVTVPEPLSSRSGVVLETIEVPGEMGLPRLCHLSRWVEGRSWARRRTPQRFLELGRLMAGLHDQAQRWKRPRGFTRPRWDFEGLTRGPLVAGPDPDATWDALPKPVRRVLETAAAAGRRAMEAVGEGRSSFGLMHADLHFHNIVFGDGECRPFDFHDAAFGYYLYDMAVAMQFDRPHQEGYAERLAALKQGYLEVRPLPPGADHHFRAFEIVRRMDLVLFVTSQTLGNPNLFAGEERGWVQTWAGWIEDWLKTV